MTNPYISKNVPNTVNNTDIPFLPNSFNTSSFLQGALIGMVATYILTNEDAQQAIFKAAVKMGKLFEVGAEELKERFEDAKAEIEAGE